MKVIPLAVAGAFHTPIMQPAVEHLKTALAEVEIQTPRIPVVTNVDAQPHENPDTKSVIYWFSKSSNPCFGKPQCGG